MIFFSVRLQEKKKKKLIREKNIMILQLVTNAYQINGCSIMNIFGSTANVYRSII